MNNNNEKTQYEHAEGEKPPTYDEAVNNDSKERDEEGHYGKEEQPLLPGYLAFHPGMPANLDSPVHTPHPRGTPGYPGQSFLTYKNSRSKPGI